MEISLGDAIRSYLKKSKFRNQMQALQLEDVWEEVMGKTIAKHTERLKIVKNTLYITTNVAPLKTELLYQKEKIIERVNEVFGEKTISEVVIN